LNILSGWLCYLTSRDYSTTKIIKFRSGQVIIYIWFWYLCIWVSIFIYDI